MRSISQVWLALGAVALAGVVGCGSSESPPAGGDPVTQAKAAVDLGPPLYPAKPIPAIPTSGPLGESTAVPATVSSELREQVPALVDGPIELLATPVDPDSVRPGDPDIVYHPRDTADQRQPYKRLRDGDIVRAGQVLARIDEQAVAIQRDTAEKTITKSMEAARVAKEGEMKQQELATKVKETNATSRSEVLQAESLVFRYIENRLAAEREVVKAQGEFLAANNLMAKHWVRSPINGRVTRLVKAQMEYARAGETILEIESLDRVRVEGKLDASLADRVKRGMRVIVEPARPAGPDTLTNSHRQEVTGVAVTGHPGRPMVVSAGMDASALVWDVTATKASHRLPHTQGVTAVACTPPTVKKQLVLTGARDGVVRVWDVSNPDKLPTTAETLPEGHTGPVSGLAISPDGRFAASSSGRDVAVYSIDDKKLLYTLPSDHRDAVTHLAFTPQGTLMTAAKDRVIRVYQLGTQGAGLQTSMEHRSGSVDRAGVSGDGARVVFDKSNTRLDLVSLGDERVVGSIQTAGGSARFATLALFSPDDRAILTASGEPDRGGELTLWQTPETGGRAAELRRVATPYGAVVTAAAFSPDPTHRFVCAGTGTGNVHFWPLTATPGGSKVLVGEVTSVAPDDAKTLTVRVELTNPLDANGDGLADRSQATIIIPPAGIELPAPDAPAPVKPTAPTVNKAAPANDVVPASASAPASRAAVKRPPGQAMPVFDIPVAPKR